MYLVVEPQIDEQAVIPVGEFASRAKHAGLIDVCLVLLGQKIPSKQVLRGVIEEYIDREY